MKTIEFRIWGWYDGVTGNKPHRQRESFSPSYKHDFSENGKIRIIEVLNSDRTGTNDYTIVKITRNTREECFEEMSGQLSDGIFENSNYGLVEFKNGENWECLKDF